MSQNLQYEEIDLRRLLNPILKRWNSIFLFVLICEVIVIGAVLRFVEREYAAESLVYINQADYSIVPDSSVVPAFNRSQLQIEVVTRFALSDRVMTETLRRLQESSPTYEDWELITLRRGTRVSSVDDTNTLIGLAYQHREAEVTAEVANMWASVLIQEFKELFSSDTPRVQSLRSQSELLAEELSTLQEQLEGTQSAERSQLEAEITARQQVYQSILLTIAYAEAGLGQSNELIFASPTQVPQQPVGRGLIQLIILTGLTSGSIAVLVILFLSLRSEEQATTPVVLKQAEGSKT